MLVLLFLLKIDMSDMKKIWEKTVPRLASGKMGKSQTNPPTQQNQYYEDVIKPNTTEQIKRQTKLPIDCLKSGEDFKGEISA